MTETRFNRAALRGFIAEHDISEPAMAAHAGIPYRTLRGVLLGHDPLPLTAAKIMAALRVAPPPKSLPKHGEQIAQLWPEHSSVEIGRELGISKQRVLKIVQVMGLPPRRNAAVKPQSSAE